MAILIRSRMHVLEASGRGSRHWSHENPDK